MWIIDLSRLMGSSSLKTVFQNIEIHLKIDENPIKTNNSHITFLIISQKIYNILFKFPVQQVRNFDLAHN